MTPDFRGGTLRRGLAARPFRALSIPFIAFAPFRDPFVASSMAGSKMSRPRARRWIGG